MEEVMVRKVRAVARRLPRPAAKALAEPGKLFGESLPELLLLVAVVAAVASAVLGLGGVA
jgi:hypothetical protein